MKCGHFYLILKSHRLQKKALIFASACEQHRKFNITASGGVRVHVCVRPGDNTQSLGLAGQVSYVWVTAPALKPHFGNWWIALSVTATPITPHFRVSLLLKFSLCSLFKIYILLVMDGTHAFLCERMPHMCAYLRRPGVEWWVVPSAGTQTKVLWKSRKSS